MIEAIVLVWIGCGILAYGITYAHFHGEYPRDPRSYTGIAATMALFGPFGLLVSLFGSDFCRHGFCVKKRRKDAQS